MVQTNAVNWPVDGTLHSLRVEVKTRSPNAEKLYALNGNEHESLSELRLFIDGQEITSFKRNQMGYPNRAGVTNTDAGRFPPIAKNCFDGYHNPGDTEILYVGGPDRDAAEDIELYNIQYGELTE